MKIDDIKLLMFRYRIDNLQLILPGINDPFTINKTFIKDMMIEKEFDTKYFPLFSVTIGVPGWVARIMRKNSGNLKMNVDIKKGKYKNGLIDPEESPLFTSYINSTFYVIMDDATLDMNEDAQERLEKDQGYYKKGMGYSDVAMIKVLLYKEDYLNRSKLIVNGILTATTLADAVTYTLNKAGINNVLMSPPNNYQSYSEFALTPISVKDQLDRICNDYPIYKTGAIIFFDFDKVYIIDKSPLCTAYTKSEYKTTYIGSLTKSTGASHVEAKGCYSNPKDKYNYLNIIPDAMNIKSNTTINDKVIGNNFAVIDTESGAISRMQAAPSRITESVPLSYFISNKGGNTAEAFKKALSEENKVFNIGFSYIDIDMLTPNKEFILTFDDAKFQKYNGKVRMTKYTIIFQEEGEYLTANVMAEFKGN